MAKIRVASVFGYLCTGGDENRLLQYLKARDTGAFEHIVVSALEPTAASLALNGPIYRKLEATGVELVTLGIPCDHEARLSRPGPRLAAAQARDFARAVRRMARLFRERRIDVVDARINMGTLLGTLAGRLAGVGGVVSTNYELETLSRPGMAPLGQAVYASVDALVCDSVANLEMLRRWMRFPPRGVCIPNGIERPRASRPREELRAELGIPAGATVIAQVARLAPYKGQDLLLQAAPAILAEFPEVVFLLCGYRQLASDYNARLERLIAEQGIQKSVRIVSYPGDIGDVWSVVDLHAHPTRRDSSPLALCEGMSLGLPAVTTDIGGIKELVAHGETGLVLPPDDVPALTAALLDLLRRPAWARQLGDAARARYEARHQPAVMARASEDLFRAVLERPRRFAA